MRNVVLIGFLLSIVIISGCLQSSPATQPVCNTPYILVGTSCCIDQNANSICDKDETTPPEHAPETQSQTVPPTTSSPTLAEATSPTTTIKIQPLPNSIIEKLEGSVPTTESTTSTTFRGLRSTPDTTTAPTTTTTSKPVVESVAPSPTTITTGKVCSTFLQTLEECNKLCAGIKTCRLGEEPYCYECVVPVISGEGVRYEYITNEQDREDYFNHPIYGEGRRKAAGME